MEKSSNPFKTFKTWFEEAKLTEQSYPESFTLSTSNQEGQPSARTVLLRGFDDQKFTFFTNYNSRKGQDISQNPKVQFLFYWKTTEKQIRIYGNLKKSAPTDSDKYWASRAYESQMNSYVSKQSSELDLSSEDLAKVFSDLKSKHPQKIPRPDNWGGYDFHPHRFEFWQEGAYRWHQRDVFELKNAVWVHDKLYP